MSARTVSDSSHGVRTASGQRLQRGAHLAGVDVGAVASRRE